MKVNLYISLYPEKIKNRFNEIEKCLIQNINNPNINQIIVLNEGFQSEFLNHIKIRNINFVKRPFFSDFYSILENDVINIIANNDIYFDNSISILKKIIQV